MVPVHMLVLAGGTTAIGAHPLLAIALLASLSLNVAVATGVLSHRGGAHPAAAVLRAGAAFAGTLALLLTVAVALQPV